jgi:hypothetical protein
MDSTWHKYWIPLTVGFIWSLIWKGFALWKAAKQDDKTWFIALLIINTAGILEIFYIFIFSKRNSSLPKTAGD